jgi:hypothetical protein
MEATHSVIAWGLSGGVLLPTLSSLARFGTSCSPCP